MSERFNAFNLVLRVIVSLALTSVASASPSWTAACGAPPPAGTLAFAGWVGRCFEHSRASCPLDPPGAVHYYINQGPNDASLGHSPSSPRNCASFRDLEVFIESTIRASPGVPLVFVLDQEDTWRATTNAPTSDIDIVASNVVIRSGDFSNPGAPGTKMARLIGGQPLPTSGWTRHPAYPDIFSHAASSGAQYITWQDGHGLRYERLFRRYAPAPLQALESGTLEAMQAADEASFVLDTWNSRWYVRLPGAWGATWNSNVRLEELFGTQSCITVSAGSGSAVDKVRIDGIEFIGWGLISETSQTYAVKVDIGGDSMCGISRCAVFFGSHHLIGLLNTSAERTGGYIWLEDVQLGASCVDLPAGNGTQFIAYAAKGGNQAVLRNVRGRIGALKTQNAVAGNDPTTDLIYSHTDGSPGALADLTLVVGCGVDRGAPVPYGGYRLGLLQGSAAAGPGGHDPDFLDSTKYTVFAVDCESHDNRSPMGNGTPVCWVNCRVHAGYSTNAQAAGLSTGTIRWLCFNSLFNFFVDLSPSTFYEASLVNPAAASTIHMVHSAMFFRVTPVWKTASLVLTRYDTLAASRWFNSGFFGSVNAKGVRAIVNNAPTIAGQVVPASATQRADGAGHEGFDATSDPILIPFTPSPESWLAGPRDLASRAVPITVPELALEYDMHWRRRGTSTAAGTNDQGVYVTPADSPPACPPDFNADGLVNPADIFFFLDAWFALNGSPCP